MTQQYRHRSSPDTHTDLRRQPSYPRPESFIYSFICWHLTPCAKTFLKLFIKALFVLPRGKRYFSQLSGDRVCEKLLFPDFRLADCPVVLFALSADIISANSGRHL